jgi:DNA-binding transcriptional LysR family regulator
MPVSRARVLPAALARFHALHPEVEVIVVEGSHGELVEPLRDGSVDLMIGALRDPSPGPDLTQRPLFPDQAIVLARAGHPLTALTGDGPVPVLPPLADLGRFPWILPSFGAPLRVGFETIFTAQGITPPQVPIQCGSVMIIREVLMQTDFLTLLSPDQVSVELQAGWLASLGEPPGHFARTIGITTRAQWRPSPIQAAFIAALEAASD